MTFNRRLFSQTVRNYRGKHTLREAAAECGAAPSTIQRIERGSKPDVDTFARLCEWIGTAPAVFFNNQKQTT